MNIGSRKREGIFQFSVRGIGQHFRNAIGSSVRITTLKALIFTSIGYALSPYDFFDKIVFYDSARQTDGTVDDHDIILFGIQIGLFEIIMDIAFGGANEAG